jgi:nicotinate-nucleotide pyrophosphorylase (carboxylating)
VDELNLQDLVRHALDEDVGDGDFTTLWAVPEARRVRARIVAKQNGVLAGLQAARAVFRQVDPELEVEPAASDGDRLRPGSLALSLSGRARSILTGERIALNFLQRLSGIATLTRAYVDAVSGTGARILDTRKTTPGLRALERAAVRAGGGTHHRFGLHDMVLIKENHIAAAGGITAAVEAVRRCNDRGLRIEVETTDLEEVREATGLKVDRILFDNMPVALLREAVASVRSAGAGIETEASGGVAVATVGEIAATGVDFVSVGALTHSAPALDLSLLLEG